MQRIVLTDKEALNDWERFKQEIINTTTVDRYETAKQKAERIAHLNKKGNEEEWMAYYFPQFYTSEPAPFHIAASRRVFDNPEWYEVRNWSRELAKSTRSMMEDLYLLLNKKKRFKLLCSASLDAAESLLAPYKVMLEINQRIINDYGKQRRLGSWESSQITTRSGFTIRAVGKGQSPRGARVGEVRPDIIEFDDIETDEDCINPDNVDKAWKWCNKAVIGTRSISKETLIRWNNNIIAEDCCVVRAAEFADHVDLVNIRDENGVSTWINKNTEEFIDRVLEVLPFAAQQSEYFNNPYTEGNSFVEMRWGKCPPLEELSFVVQYADPGTSNKDLTALKKTSKNSTKATFLVGHKDGKYYIYTGFVNHMNNSKFIDCMYQLREYVNIHGKGKTQLYSYIENNSLQAPFYEQVLEPAIVNKGKLSPPVLGVIPDGDKKPDKFFRIDGLLQPLNNMGCLILNEEERENPHMKRCEAQFKSVSPRSKTMDAPDAITGAVTKINAKIATLGKDSVMKIRHKPNRKKRF